MVTINYGAYPSAPDLSGLERGLAGLGQGLAERRERKQLEQQTAQAGDALGAVVGENGEFRPDPQAMRELLRNPVTRPIAIDWAKSRMQPADPDADLKRQKLEAEIHRLRNPVSGGGGGGGARFGLTPQTGVDAEGNPVLIQLSDDGTSIRTPLPEGVSISKAPIRLDAGTEFILLDPITRQPVGRIPKDIAGRAAQEEIGTADGKAAAAAAGDFQAGANALDIIGSLRHDPNRPTGTGWSGQLGNWVPASPGYDFQTKVDQAKSGAFLSAIQQLRGMGALSNAEGQTATAAVTRLNTAASEQEFLNALSDYERVVRQGMSRAGRKAERYGVELPNAGGAEDPLGIR